MIAVVAVRILRTQLCYIEINTNLNVRVISSN
jgi:hypothetical protein